MVLTFLRKEHTMLYFSKDILYHFLLMLFPITIYQNFLKEDNRVRRLVRSKFLFIVLITLILTMSNPIEYHDGFIYDFRVIPIVIAFLYGGIQPGLLTIIVMLLYRCVSGGGGFYVTLVNYIIATGLLLLIQRKFDSLQIKTKVALISGFYWAIACTRGITLVMMDQTDQLPFMLAFSILTFVTLVIIVFMIENINKQFALKEELERSERLNVVSQLAASIAHEVRNPMTSIKGFMQLLKEDSNLNPTQKYYIKISLDELDRTEAIINEYLSLARPVSPQNEPVNLSHEIKSTIDLITSFTNVHNIEIHSFIEDSLYTQGRKGEIKQVLLNIIKNGVEAMGSKGILTIRAYNKKSIHVIEIIDNGVGMTQQQIKRIGTPFYSTKDKGTGVGLSVSYSIIRNMKGSIEVESELNRGTAFTITLPVYYEN